MAVPQQAARLRRVVGRRPGRPGTARGVARPRRPRRAASDAHVLRHPRPARARLPDARRPRRRRRLAAHLLRGRRAHPRLPTPARHPGGRQGLASDPEVPRRDPLLHRLRVRRPRSHRALRDPPAAPGRLHRRAGVGLPRPRRPRRRAGHQAPACSPTTACSSVTPGCSTTATRGGSAGSPSGATPAAAAWRLHSWPPPCRSARADPIVLDAQTGLVRWYAGYGFEVSGPEFLDGGVPHQPMRRD